MINPVAQAHLKAPKYSKGSYVLWAYSLKPSLQIKTNLFRFWTVSIQMSQLPSIIDLKGGIASKFRWLLQPNTCKWDIKRYDLILFSFSALAIPWITIENQCLFPVLNLRVKNLHILHFGHHTLINLILIQKNLVHTIRTLNNKCPEFLQNYWIYTHGLLQCVIVF